MFLSSDMAPARSPGDDFWFTPIGTKSASGVRVTPAAALAVSTFYACCLVLAQTLASVPAHLYKARAEKGKDRAVDNPLYRLIHRRPNRWQTAYQWFQMMQWHAVLRYNAYSRILFDRAGTPTELIPMHPDHVKVERFKGSQGVTNFRYRWKPEGFDEMVLTRWEVLHIRGLTSDGIEGFSPLDVQKDSIGEAITAQSYSARRLANDARPGGVLEWESHFKDDIERRKFRQSWQEAQAGSNQGKTAVLEKGMTWKDLGVKNTDLQFIELRELKAYDVASMFRMPPHKVGLLKRATFTNIEHQGIEFVTDTMDPWFVNWEQELSAQLLREEDQASHEYEFLRVALLRGDAKTRGEFYGKRFSIGSMSPNDIREAENENPVDGGDRYFVPVNMVPVDKVDEALEARAQQPAAPAGPGGADNADDTGDTQTERERELEQAAAGRVVRKEVAALRRLPGGGEAKAEAGAQFYAEHREFVAEVLVVDDDVANGYCARRAEAFAAAVEGGGVDQYLVELEANGVADLIASLPRDVESEGHAVAAAVSELAGAIAKQPAPVVQNNITVPSPSVKVTNEVNPTPVQVNVPAPSVEVTNNVQPAPVLVENNVAIGANGQPLKMEITSMPTRQSTSETVRDKQDRIKTVKQTEKDA